MKELSINEFDGVGDDQGVDMFDFIGSEFGGMISDGSAIANGMTGP